MTRLVCSSCNTHPPTYRPTDVPAVDVDQAITKWQHKREVEMSADRLKALRRDVDQLHSNVGGSLTTLNAMVKSPGVIHGDPKT